MILINISKLKYGRLRLIAVLTLFASLLLAACSGGTPITTSNATTTSESAIEIPTATILQSTATTPAESVYPAPQAQTLSGEAYPAPEQASGETAQNEAQALPLALTPAQTEGPYYPVEKPADTDNDLTIVDGSDTAAAGEVLLLTGRVLDVNGQPIADATVQIWQTDNQGIYLHPNDPKVDQRDPNFQSYGESVTSADGSYGFKTILPGSYEPRPRHIHVKVVKDGETLLTTQFYFTGDDRLANDPVSVGVSAELSMTTRTGEDEAGNPALMAQKDIVLPAQ